MFRIILEKMLIILKFSFSLLTCVSKGPIVKSLVTSFIQFLTLLIQLFPPGLPDASELSTMKTTSRGVLFNWAWQSEKKIRLMGVSINSVMERGSIL